jgi:general secretion pathway protein G
MNKNKNRGFTLIELLVVIAIIGILSSIVIVNLNIARAKARDAKRVQDLLQIKTALELYRNQYGSYPQCGESYCGRCNTATGDPLFKAALQPLVTNGFISSIPTDPYGNNTSCYTYEYHTNNISLPGITCGGVPADSLPYFIRFSTERDESIKLPLFSMDRVSGKEYCMTTP